MQQRYHELRQVCQKYGPQAGSGLGNPIIWPAVLPVDLPPVPCTACSMSWPQIYMLQVAHRACLASTAHSAGCGTVHAVNTACGTSLGRGLHKVCGPYMLDLGLVWIRPINCLHMLDPELRASLVQVPHVVCTQELGLAHAACSNDLVQSKACAACTRPLLSTGSRVGLDQAQGLCWIQHIGPVWTRKACHVQHAPQICPTLCMGQGTVHVVNRAGVSVHAASCMQGQSRACAACGVHTSQAQHTGFGTWASLWTHSSLHTSPAPFVLFTGLIESHIP